MEMQVWKEVKRIESETREDRKRENMLCVDYVVVVFVSSCFRVVVGVMFPTFRFSVVFHDAESDAEDTRWC